MRYCTRCVMPDTKPHLTFNDEGVCSACQANESKVGQIQSIDWHSRAKQFDRIIEEVKAVKAPYFDALVPVSGGKDSITQVHRLLNRGLRILAVNIDYGIKTEIGLHNLALIPEMGASLFTFRPELTLHKRLIRLGFEQYGDPDLLSHTLLHAGPLHMAINYRVPLVLLGENSAFEYGGDTNLASLNHVTRDWFNKYAANNGRDARYISDTYSIPFENLVMYDFPDHLTKSGVRTVFSSFYFPWDSEEHLTIAQKYGFQSLPHPGEGTYRTYVGLDEIINRIHQYFKVLKFGYGRATDHACEDLRAGRISRDKAKELIREHDLTPLSATYVNRFCEFIDMKPTTFHAILDRYRNPDIWKRDRNGLWHIPGHLEE